MDRSVAARRSEIHASADDGSSDGRDYSSSLRSEYKGSGTRSSNGRDSRHRSRVVAAANYNTTENYRASSLHMTRSEPSAEAAGGVRYSRSRAS